MLTNETEAERYRKELVVQANHIELLKRELSELTDAHYTTLGKMKEVCDERDNLRIQVENLQAQLNIQHYWDSGSA
jgi:hypothetical protein